MSAINSDIYTQLPRLAEIRHGQADHKPVGPESKDSNGTCRDVFTPCGNDPTHEVSRKDMWKWMGTGGHGLPAPSTQPLPNPCLTPPITLDMPRLMGTGGF